MCDYGTYDLVEYAAANELKIQGKYLLHLVCLVVAVNVFTVVQNSALEFLRWEGTEGGHSLKRCD